MSGNSFEAPSPGVEAMAPLQRQGTLRESVAQLGPRVLEQAVIVGSTAIHEALGDDARQPADIDLLVSEEVFAGLKQARNDWQVLRMPNGEEYLSNGDFDIGTHWTHKGQSHEKLRERGWRNEHGMTIVSLPDIITWKDGMGREKDLADMDIIRRHLLDPERPPLDARIAHNDIAMIKFCLHLDLGRESNLQPGLALAANGLLSVATLYGLHITQRALPIVGELDPLEHGVRAYAHSNENVLMDMWYLARHMLVDDMIADRAPTFTPEECVQGLAALTYSHICRGNGGPHNNPTGYDALRSAQLVRSHALARGFSAKVADRLYDAVDATALAQSDDPLAQAVVGARRQAAISEYQGVIIALESAIEDLVSATHDPARLLGRVAAEHGEVFYSAEQAYRFIDAHPDASPKEVPHAPTIATAVIDRLQARAQMIEAYQFPESWTLEKLQVRREIADKCFSLAEELKTGKSSFREIYGQAVRWMMKSMVGEMRKEGHTIY